jgi:predicted DNA-binding transcriptional regulator AlpA
MDTGVNTWIGLNFNALPRPNKLGRNLSASIAAPQRGVERPTLKRFSTPSKLPLPKTVGAIAWKPSESGAWGAVVEALSYTLIPKKLSMKV